MTVKEDTIGAYQEYAILHFMPQHNYHREVSML